MSVFVYLKIDSERHGQLGYAGLSGCDVFGRTPLMYAAVADSKPCLDMLLTCGAKREVVRKRDAVFVESKSLSSALYCYRLAYM